MPAYRSRTTTHGRNMAESFIPMEIIFHGYFARSVYFYA
jgi:hypothetical protein